MDTILEILPGEGHNGIHMLVDISVCVLNIPTILMNKKAQNYFKS